MTRFCISSNGIFFYSSTTCKTSQVLFAGVPGGFGLGSRIFAHLLIGLIRAEILILKGTLNRIRQINALKAVL